MDRIIIKFNSIHRLILIAFKGLTGSKESQELLYKCPEIITALAKLTADKDAVVSKDSLLCLVNLSAEEEGAEVLLKSVSNHQHTCFFTTKTILRPKFVLNHFFSN